MRCYGSIQMVHDQEVRIIVQDLFRRREAGEECGRVYISHRIFTFRMGYLLFGSRTVTQPE